MAKLFISYKREDKKQVFSIIKNIKQETGLDYWIDIDGIESGDQFQKVIIRAIDNADIVVFMLSKNFIAPYTDSKTGLIDSTKQTFPEKEVMYALRHNKRLVPISIDGTTVYDCNWLEFNCSGLDYIIWNNADQRSKLYKNLTNWSPKSSINETTTKAKSNTEHKSQTSQVLQKKEKSNYYWLLVCVNVCYWIWSIFYYLNAFSLDTGLFWVTIIVGVCITILSDKYLPSKNGKLNILACINRFVTLGFPFLSILFLLIYAHFMNK